jgi:hypothetical protein
VTYALYELPFGRGKRFMNNAHPVVNGILGNWEFNATSNSRERPPIELYFRWSQQCLSADGPAAGHGSGGDL